MSNGYPSPPASRWSKRRMDITPEEYADRFKKIFPDEKDEVKSTNKSSGVKRGKE